MNRQGIFRNMIFSYLFIALVPFCFLSVSLVRQSNEHYTRTLLDRSLSDVERINAVLDVRMLECRAMAYQIGATSPLLNIQISGSSEYDSLLRLDELRAGNQFIQSIAIWQQDNDNVYTTRGLMTKPVFTQSYLRIHMDDKSIANAIADSPMGFFRVCPDGFTILYALPCRLSSPLQALVMFTFDARNIRPMFVGDANDYMLLLDNSGQVLYHNIPLESEALYELISSETVDIHGDKYYVLHTDNAGMLSVYTLLAQSDCGIPLRDIAVSLGMSAVLLIGCIALCVCIARLNFKPVRKLGDMLGEEGKVYKTWDELHKDVYQTIQRNEEYIETILEQKRQLKEHFLVRLLSGYPDSSEATEARRAMEIPDDLSHCCVACVRIGGTLRSGQPASVQPDSEQSGSGQSDPVQSSSGRDWHQAMEMIAKHGELTDLAIEIEQEDIIALVFFLDEDSGEAEAERRCLRAFSDTDGMDGVTIGIGRAGLFTELRTSYLQALAALQTLAPDPGAKLRLLRFEDMMQAQEPLPAPKEPEIYLTLALEQGDARLALENLNLLIQRAVNAPHAQMHYICYRLVELIVPAMNQTLGTAEGEHMRQALTAEINASQLESFRKLMMRGIDEICAERNRQSERSSSELKLAVLACVHENFADSRLSLEYLSDRFGYSCFYWSRYFKEVVGQNFSDYVWALRLERAKALLATPIKATDVVERVGYIDVRSFNRKFKNSMGVTPVQYKRNLENDKALHEQ